MTPRMNNVNIGSPYKLGTIGMMLGMNTAILGSPYNPGTNMVGIGAMTEMNNPLMMMYPGMMLPGIMTMP